MSKSKIESMFDDMQEDTSKAGIGQASSTGFSAGQGIGAGLDRPGGAAQGTANAIPSARSALGGRSSYSGGGRAPTGGGGGNSPEAPAVAPASPSGPSSAATPAQGSSGASEVSAGPAGPSIGIGHGPIQRSLDGKCSVCSLEKCNCSMGKALKAGALVIPRHLRAPAYDPNAIYRSATSQTSKMYTALAKPVEETLEYLEKDSQKLRNQAMKSQEESSRKVQEMREKLNAAVVPKIDTKYSKR